MIWNDMYRLWQYHCLDLVTEGVGRPHSVLIRAVEPIDGIELMQRSRHSENLFNLTTGPGKLCQAFQITRELNGVDVTAVDAPIVVLVAIEPIKPAESICTVRIGVSKAADLPLRFYLKGNQFVSSLKRRSPPSRGSQPNRLHGTIHQLSSF